MSGGRDRVPPGSADSSRRRPAGHDIPTFVTSRSPLRSGTYPSRNGDLSQSRDANTSRQNGRPSSTTSGTSPRTPLPTRNNILARYNPHSPVGVDDSDGFEDNDIVDVGSSISAVEERRNGIYDRNRSPTRDRERPRYTSYDTRPGGSVPGNNRDPPRYTSYDTRRNRPALGDTNEIAGNAAATAVMSRYQDWDRQSRPHHTSFDFSRSAMPRAAVGSSQPGAIDNAIGVISRRLSRLSAAGRQTRSPSPIRPRASSPPRYHAASRSPPPTSYRSTYSSPRLPAYSGTTTRTVSYRHVRPADAALGPIRESDRSGSDSYRRRSRSRSRSPGRYSSRPRSMSRPRLTSRSPSRRPSRRRRRISITTTTYYAQDSSEGQ